MLKKVAALATVLFLMGQFFFQLGMLAWFSINRAEIAAAHCVNKSLPKSCCYGKCYISNQLSDMKDQAGEEKQITENDIPVFLVSELITLSDIYRSHTTGFADISTVLPGSFLHVDERPPESHLS